MVITKNVKALKHEIEKLVESRYFYLRQLSEGFFKQYNYLIFQEVNIRLYDKKIKAYDVTLKAVEIYVAHSYIITYDNNIISVYSFDNQFKFKKVREMRSHMLLFSIKTSTINKKTRFILYNILLSLISQKIKMVDKFLENVMVLLNVEQLNDVYIKNGYLYCVYDNLNTKVFDQRLSEVECELFDEEEPIEQNKKMIFEDFAITIFDDGLKIDYVKKTYIEIIDIPNLKQVFCYGSNLFVLTDSIVKVLSFSNDH